ncbi:MAG: STAS domain-containing protein [Candidatus Obscuribacterales bacterium]
MSEKIAILKIGRFLLVSIQVDMHDRMALEFQDDLSQAIVRHRSRGVLIDISALEIVDSFIGRLLANIAKTARLLDAETVVVGMRPAVAITMVELGLSLTGVKTALNAEDGMQLLEERDAADLAYEQMLNR